ncbi:hypothetical protein [Owenweeksia hongkongensis]|uniref:hypothetical protein n=1 Tax=Owenweeksia hongkongensis TaxID=253245 RepID=UPI003A8E6F2A
MLQYQGIVTYKLIGCKPVDKNKQDTSYTPVFKITPELDATYVAGEGYVVDPTSLSSAFKTSDVTIETYEETGTLKSINAKAEDKTDDFIKNTVELGVKVASIAGGVPTAAVAVSGSPEEEVRVFVARYISLESQPVCNGKAREAINAVKGYNQKIKELTKTIADDTNRVEAITARAAIKLNSDSDREKLASIQERQITNSTDLTELQEKAGKAGKILSFSETITWPENPFENNEVIYLSARWAAWIDVIVDQAKLRAISDEKKLEADLKLAEIRLQLLENGNSFSSNQTTIPPKPPLSSIEAVNLASKRIKEINDIYVRCSDSRSDGACLASELGLHASLEPVGGIPTVCRPNSSSDSPCVTSRNTIQARDNRPDSGVFVRPPERAKLVICDKQKPCSNTARKPILDGDLVMAPQAGQLRFIPLSNGPFQNNGLSIALRKDGTVEKLQYAEKSAVAAAAASSFAATATSVESYLAEREKAKKEAEAAAKAEIVAARTERAAVRDEAAKDRADEIAKIQFKIDQLKKEKELLELQAPPVPADDPIVSEEITNETLRINAEVELLRARLARLKAEQEYAQLIETQ